MSSRTSKSHLFSRVALPLILALIPASPLRADVTISASQPTTDILATKALGTTLTQLFSINANANHARGQLFSLGDGAGSAYEINAITIQKNTTQTFVNDTITLRIFQGTSTQWTSGTGHTNASPNFYVGTDVQELGSEVFTIDGVISANNFVTFELASPLLVPENSELGFFLTYDQIGGTQTSFSHLEAANGGRISIDTDSHDVSSRSMNHFVQGTVAEGGTVTTSPTAPTSGIISSSPIGSTDTAIFDEEANANHARGQLFNLPNGSGLEYEITALTIRKSTTQIFANDTLTLRIFEGSGSQWDNGTGHSSGTDADNYYVGTGVTPIHSESFTLDGSFTDSDYVTLKFGSPVTVNENSNFGFFLTYDQSDNANTDRFQHFENTSGGGRISISTSAHDISTSRRMVYFIEGAPIGISETLTLGAPFQDDMVLQRDKPISVWGMADPNAPISVAIDGLAASGTSDANGKWKVQLPSLSSGGPHHLTVVSGPDSVTLSNVLIGDVWFAFGQSNMVRPLGEMTGREFYIDEIENNNVPVRCLKVTQFGALTPQEDPQVPSGHYVSGSMNWLPPSSSESWTSVGTVFAYRMYEATGVPTAIIWSAFGSSSVEGWMPEEMAEQLPHFKDLMSDYFEVGKVGTLHGYTTSNGFSTNEAALTSLLASGWVGATSQQDIFVRTRPNILYNQTVHPFLNFGISGFIWYQGEANAGAIDDAAQYAFSLPAMIKEYRSRFNQGDLPFLGVQLPSFNQSPWPWFREYQERATLLPKVHLAVTIDTGLSNNIHPFDKEPIGVRLSLLAREFVLGEAIESSGPRFDSLSINGNQVTVKFTHAGGLTTDDGLSPATFEVAGADGTYHAATSSSINGTSVIISSSSEPAPVSVRYAWSPAPVNEVNLVNSDGLPAAPFRTDSLPAPGLGAQAPQSVNDSYQLPAGQSSTIPPKGILTNDIDLNHDTLTASLVGDTSSGTLALLPDGSFTYTPNTGFTGSDRFTYQASDGALTSPTATVNLTIVSVPSPYDIWKSTIAWNPGDDQLPDADPDGDGSTNLLEFALGMNPLLADPAGLPSISLSGGNLLFDFNNAQPGVIYEVQTSFDLITWSDPAFATLTHESTTPVTIPAPDTKIFVRLKVSE